mgnify:FL=1|jgi:hypothetical protein
MVAFGSDVSTSVSLCLEPRLLSIPQFKDVFLINLLPAQG